jgi:hypothetical protein
MDEKKPIESTAIKRPLTIAEVAIMLRQKPRWIVCGWTDAITVLRKLRNHGFKFRRERRGYWLILDKEFATVTGHVQLSPLCKEGEMYLLDRPKPLSFVDVKREHDKLYNRWMMYGE